MPRATSTNNQRKGMVDISDKTVTKRTAIAQSSILLGNKAFKALINDECPKGNVLETAKVAGIMAAKKTSDLIPLCHPLQLNNVDIQLMTDEDHSTVHCIAEVKTSGKTGVEMEALTAVQITLLTIYDMCKAMDRGMVMNGIALMSKSGGKSGDWHKE